MVPSVLQKWVSALSSEINEECKIGRDLGHGFFQVVMKEEAAMQRVLMLTPHLSKWGTCIMQPWMPAFVSSRPHGTRMPLWLTLKNVPEEFLSSAQEMAGSLGTVLGRHRRNAVSADQKFCVAVKTGVPFDMVLEAMNPENGKSTLIHVDYNNLPIRCRYCLSTSHLVKNCSAVAGQKRPQRNGNANKPGVPKLIVREKGKALEVISEKNVSSKIRVEGDGAANGKGSLGENISQEGGLQWRQTQRTGQSETIVALALDKQGTPVAREGQNKGRTGGAASSSVDKVLRPQKSIKKVNTHSKPFMTLELWKACELATGQALSPKRGDFSDINEYNNCCCEWMARECIHLNGDRSSDIQLLSRFTQEGEPRRKLESHLAAATNSLK